MQFGCHAPDVGLNWHVDIKKLEADDKTYVGGYANWDWYGFEWIYRVERTGRAIAVDDGLGNWYGYRLTVKVKDALAAISEVADVYDEKRAAEILNRLNPDDIVVVEVWDQS